MKAGDKTFTLFWRTGQREIVHGRDPAEAMTLAGYSSGAVRALDFWADGDNHRYEWDPKNREWNSLDMREAVARRIEAEGRDASCGSGPQDREPDGEAGAPQ